MKSASLVSFCLFSLLASQPADAAPAAEKIGFKVEKFRLDNGLTVLIHEDHTMPIISYHQWFRVGSSHERPGRTGMAHFFEHLMFKGTTKYPKGEIDRIIQMNGGSNNAFTTEDYTGYYINLPADKLELAVDIESDRMRNLVFDEKEVNSEREVVKEERRMRYENSIYGSLHEMIRQTIYKTSVYRWPVIGSMADLSATKIPDFKAFYNTYYAPNNAVVVIAGAVKTRTARRLIEKYYGPIARQEIPKGDFKPEAEQKSPRFARAVKDVQSTTMAIVYPGPAAGSEDVYALDLLAGALGGGPSSRLHKRLVYKNRLATSASVGSTNQLLSGTFGIFLALTPGASAANAVALVNDELMRVKREKVDALELQKLKNQVKLAHVRGLQTMDARAESLALNEIYFSDYSRLFRDLEKYEAVTAEDIQRVAGLYIQPPKRSLIEIVPQGAAPATAEPAAATAPATPAEAPKPVEAQENK